MSDQPTGADAPSNTANTAVHFLTAQIVSAHLSRNQVSSAEIPPLIRSVFNELASCKEGRPAVDKAADRPEPVVPIQKSVYPGHIICLEDGKKLKMLRRHLRVAYNMTPEQYREKWGLPPSYPMVAPKYAETRSMLAKRIGLGRMPRSDRPVVQQVPEGKRGRRKKAAG